MSKAAFLVLASALCIFAADGLLAQFPTTPRPQPTQPPPQSRGSTFTHGSTFKKYSGKAWYEIQKSMGTENKDWERQQKSNSGGNAIRGDMWSFWTGNKVRNVVWIGSWIRQECTEAGGAAGVGCASQPSTGKLILNLTSPGSSVEGTIYLGEVEVTLASKNISDGTKRVTGWGRVPTSDVTITNWNSNESGGAVTGNFTLTFHPDDATVGTVIVRAAMQDMKKMH